MQGFGMLMTKTAVVIYRLYSWEIITGVTAELSLATLYKEGPPPGASFSHILDGNVSIHLLELGDNV